jgi:hypothetical protein
VFQREEGIYRDKCKARTVLSCTALLQDFVKAGRSSHVFQPFVHYVAGGKKLLSCCCYRFATRPHEKLLSCRPCGLASHFQGILEE